MSVFDPTVWSAVEISLRVALVAVAAMLVPGILTAWWLARGRSRWTALVEAVVNLPLVLPPVVVGYLLLRLIGRRGWLGGCCTSIWDSTSPSPGGRPRSPVR